MPNDDRTSAELSISCEHHSQLQLGSYLAVGLRARLLRSKAPIEGAADGSFAVFVYEYWHHLHNVTTLTAVERFRANQLLVSLFSKTIVPDLREAIGSLTKFSGEDTHQFHEQLQVLKSLEGEKGPTGRTDRMDVEARVVSVSGSRITVEILKQGTIVGTEQFLLGAKAI